MALFQTDEQKRLANLFGTRELDTVVWRDKVDHLLSFTAPTFDMRVRTGTTPLTYSNAQSIGVTYLPDGPVVRMPQDFIAGSELLFSQVDYLPGKEIAIVSGAPFTTTVSASPGGSLKPKESKDAGEIAQDVGAGAMFMLLLAFIAYKFYKDKK